MFKQQQVRLQQGYQSPIYQAHLIQRQSIPPQIPSQVYRNQQSAAYKMNSSTKKTNKINLYSKKCGQSIQKAKSPNKNQPYKNINSETNQVKTNTFANIKNLGDNILGQMNNIIQSNLKNALPGIMTKMVKKNTTPNYNVVMNQQKIPTQVTSQKRINAKYHFQYSNNNDNQKFQKNNISQMIDKEVYSEINTSGMINEERERQTSFFVTGRSGGSFNLNQINQQNYQIVQNNIHNVTNMVPIQTLNNLTMCMREQILLAKQNYQKKFIENLKENVIKIKQLQDRILKNQIMLKQKNQIIGNMSQVLHNMNKNNNKQNRNNLITAQQTVKETEKYEYLQNKINDLQNKLRIIQSYLKKDQKTNNNSLATKVQVLQKYLINFMSNKLIVIKSQLNSFINKSHEKIIKIDKIHSQYIQKLKQDMQNYKNNPSINVDKNNQNKIKQVIDQFKAIQAQIKSFMTRQFKYHNVGVQDLRIFYQELKQNIRVIESQQFENKKLTKQIVEQLQAIKLKFLQINQSSKPLSPLQAQFFIKNLNSSGIQETFSKYTKTNPNNPNISNISNLSNMISFDELSQTNQYSYMVQKLNLNVNQCNSNNLNKVKDKNQRIVNANNDQKNDSSIISMNFTEQLEDQQLQSFINSKKSKQNEQKQLKKTNTQINSPTTTKKSTISNLANNKINLNISNNNSYLSIGQLQDYYGDDHVILTQNNTMLLRYENNLSPDRFYKRNEQNNYNNNYNYNDDDEFFYYQQNNDKSERRSSKKSQFIQEDESFSPIKNKIFVSTENNFYQNNIKSYHIQHTNSHNYNQRHHQMNKNQHLSTYPHISHSSISFDYETFVDSDQENEKQNFKNKINQKDSKRKIMKK